MNDGNDCDLLTRTNEMNVKDESNDGDLLTRTSIRIADGAAAWRHLSHTSHAATNLHQHESTHEARK